MTRKDYIIATIAAVLGLVVYEVLKRTVRKEKKEKGSSLLLTQVTGGDIGARARE